MNFDLYAKNSLFQKKSMSKVSDIYNNQIDFLIETRDLSLDLTNPNFKRKDSLFFIKRKLYCKSESKN